GERGSGGPSGPPLVASDVENEREPVYRPDGSGAGGRDPARPVRHSGFSTRGGGWGYHTRAVLRLRLRYNIHETVTRTSGVSVSCASLSPGRADPNTVLEKNFGPRSGGPNGSRCGGRGYATE